MAVTTLDITTHLLQRAPAQRVYLRNRWNSAWELQPHLYCTMTRSGIAPTPALAQLHWLYGLIQQPTDNSITEYPPLEVLGWFVKIETDWIKPDGSTETKKHFGYISEEDRERRGTLVQGGMNYSSGQQHLIAVGIDYLYRRQRIDRALVRKLSGSQHEIRRGITFNAENPVNRNTGNRSAGVAGGGHYVFEEDLANASYWSTRNIIEYLHRVFRPLGSNDFDLMDWVLDSPYLTLLPNSDRPRVEAHDRTLGEVFDELMNRRRGLGWHVFVDDEENKPYIRPLSLTGTPVTMPEGWTLEAARNQINIYSDEAVQQISPIIKRSILSQYDQVKVIGERIRSVFTVSAADSTLEADWTAAQRSAYNAGASALGDYPGDAADTALREAANDRVRRRPDLDRVYSCFKLTDTLSYVRDGLGGTLTPWLPSEANAAQPESVYRPELRLLPYLPIDEHEIAGEARQYMRPLVVVLVKDTDGDRYMPIDQLGQLARVEELGDGNGFRWSGHVRMAEHDAAFWVHTSGKPQHVLASNASDFVALTDGSDDRDPPEIDWRSDLVATVCVEAQRNVEMVWPASVTITDSDSVRRLLIDLGEAARLDYIATGTVLGLSDDGELVHQTGGVYLRDDRFKMQALAKQAWIWYQRVRQAVRVSFAGYYPGVNEGDYLVEIGNADDAETIEAVVSQVEHDFVRGVTTIHTDYAEIDFRRIV